MIIPEANRLGSVEEYYFSKKLAQIAQLEKQGKSIINLAIGNPDLPPPSEAVQEIRAASQNMKLHGYQSYRGVAQLREAISDWNKRIYNIHFNPESEILPLIGSKEGIFHIIQAFTNPGDKVLIPNPGYPTYSSVSKLAECELIPYSLAENNNWQIDFNELSKIDLDSVKIMWLNTPHMPTGSILQQEVLEKLIGLAKQHQFLIINDNPYSLILNDAPASIFSIPGAKEVCLELNSISKTFNMAGWRVGWVIGGSSYITSILKVKSNMDSGMFLPLQLGAVKALEMNSDWYKDLNIIYKERRKFAYQLLSNLDCTYDEKQVGLFVWAKLPENASSDITFIDNILEAAGIFITPGSIFGSKGKGYIRISLCNSDDTFTKAIQRLKKLN